MGLNSVNSRYGVDQTLALATVESFLCSVGKHEPLTQQHVFPNAFHVLCYPGQPLVHSTLAQHASHMESVFDGFRAQGHISVQEVTIDDDDQQVWTYLNLAAVWTTTSILLDGRTTNKTANLFTLHLEDRSWKISGIASARHGSESYETVDIQELTKPVNILFEHLKNKNWAGMSSTLVAGGGATVWRPPGGAFTLGFDAFVDRLKAVFGKDIPPGTVYEEKVFQVQGKQAANASLAFLWTPFVVEMNGLVIRKGVKVFTLTRDDSLSGCSWRITGLQDTGTPVDYGGASYQ